MLAAAPGVTCRYAFEVKWAFQDSGARGLRQRLFPGGAIKGNRAFMFRQRNSEQEMTSDFREELVALLPRLRRFALTLTGDLDQADDLVQLGCEKALRAREQWQEGTRLDSWLYRIIQNLHIDNLRSQGRRSEHLHEDNVEDLVDSASKDRPERENMLSVLSTLIHQLPEEQRVVMLLVAVEEHSYREAAEVLQIPVGTVMSRLARARTRIMAMLDESAARGEGKKRNA